MLFGDRLRMLREDRDITQKELGQIVGVSDRVIGYYEANNRFPKDENTLKALADYFNVSLDYLLGRNENKKTINEENYNTFLEIEFDNEKLKLNKEDIKELLNKLKNIGFDIKKLL